MVCVPKIGRVIIARHEIIARIELGKQASARSNARRDVTSASDRVTARGLKGARKQGVR